MPQVDLLERHVGGQMQLKHGQSQGEVFRKHRTLAGSQHPRCHGFTTLPEPVESTVKTGPKLRCREACWDVFL